MTTPPTGTVTFLFTDIEGSTALWETHGDAMQAAVACHDDLVRAAIESNSGHVFKTGGDSFCAAFATAPDAVAAALDLQNAISSNDWGEVGSLRVRSALHTGAAEHRDGDYFGQPLNRCARLLSAAHGGQCVLSLPTEELARDALPDGVSLDDLGEHRLRDLGRPERVFQLKRPDLASDFPALLTLDAFPNNLPIQTTSFVGREKEIARVKEMMDTARLVTLTAIGGAGKTRLSLQVAADVLPRFPQGAWFIELAPVADPKLVPQTIISTLGLHNDGSREPTELLATYFEDRETLLVLDNCEHVLDSCARLVDTLLHRCPKLQILASSREGLGIGGEQILGLPSLSLPDIDHLPEAESFTQYEAVRLFVDRAVSVSADFKVTNENAPAVAGICARLDGVPLAIELAASRVKMLSPKEIADRLDHRFRLLTGGSRTALPRQQTLQAAMDWSHDLLDDRERALLRRLSVFSGGWTLDATEAVCAGNDIEGWEVLDLLGSLVDKSLVVVKENADGSRYSMLETVRQYARDRLVESEEGDEARGRHLVYFRAFTEIAAPEFTGSEVGVWIARVVREHDNIRMALGWCDSIQDVESGLRIAIAMVDVWHDRGQFMEGADRLELLLATSETEPPTALFAWALRGLALFRLRLGLHQDALPPAQNSLEIFRLLGDHKGEAQALNMLATLNGSLGRGEDQRRMLEQSISLHRTLGDDLAVSTRLHNLALNYRDYRGDLITARQMLEECQEVAESYEAFRHHAYISRNLGVISNLQGRFTRARDSYMHALGICQEIGNESLACFLQGDVATVELALGNKEASWSMLAKWQSHAEDFGGRDQLRECLLTRGYQSRLAGHYDQAIALYERCIPLYQGSARSDLAFLRTRIGSVHICQQDYEGARDCFNQVLAIADELEPEARPTVLGELAILALDLGEVEKSESLLEEAVDVSRTLGMRRAVADGLFNLALPQTHLGQLDEARSSLNESHDIYRANEERPAISDVLDRLARVAIAESDFETAAGRLRESLELRIEMGTKPRIAESFAKYALLAAAQGKAERALTLAGAAQALRDTMGLVPIPRKRKRLEEGLTGARITVDDDGAEEAMSEGRAMTMEDACAFAFDEADA